MKPFNLHIISCLWVAIMFIGVAQPQDKKTQLQADKKKIEEEIEYTNKLLEETKETKKASLDHLVIIRNKVSNRQKLIETIGSEIEIVEEQIAINNEIIKDLSKDLENLREEYAKMVWFAYKNRSAYNKLMFIFSASDFNQAYQRMKYFSQYSEYRKKQAAMITSTRRQINEAIAELESFKHQKLSLLSSKEQEIAMLNNEKKEQNRMIEGLTDKEKELVALLEEKEQAAMELQREIERIIAEEMRLAAEKTGSGSSSTFSLTPAEKILSDNFEANMGGLPWPLERGIISSYFGEHPHPLLKNVKTKNNGINILTDTGTKARAVFAGTVTRVMSIPSYNYVVMIRHGAFLSVYSNLDEVYVEKGDPVEIKQEIGRVFTNLKDNKTELHFELWKSKTLLDPAKWLAGGAEF